MRHLHLDIAVLTLRFLDSRRDVCILERVQVGDEVGVLARSLVLAVTMAAAFVAFLCPY